MEDAMPESTVKLPGLCQGERDRLSRTTTHLANTRTFLAWVRTAIALMAFGFVLERVDLLLYLTPAVGKREAIHQLGILSQVCFTAGAVILVLAGLRTRSIALRIGSDGTRFRGLAETVILALVLGVAIYFVFNGHTLLM